MNDAASDRRRELAAIHAAAAKLGLDTADKSPASDYRAMLQAQAGVTSAAALDARGRKKVLAYLLRHAAPAPRPPDGWQADKIRKLWARLGEAGALSDPSERGLNAFVLSQTRMTHLRFVPAKDANRVIEALKAWLHRKEAQA